MKTHGFFVDLASNDAVWASNTFALEQNLDWKGICIEANPIYWYRLAFRTNCQVVGAIVGRSDFDELVVSLPKDPKLDGPYGGIAGGDFDNKKGDQPRYTASLLTILNKFQAPKIIDYLSLDVEGAEELILGEFPFHQPYTFKVMSIERPEDLLKQKLQEAGYKHVIDFKAGDALWAHESVYDKGNENIQLNPKEINQHIINDWPKS